MKWWQITTRDADLERELRSDLELEVEEQKDRGLSSSEARFAAKRAFGNTALIREQTHEVWGWTPFEHLWQDFQYSLRQLLRAPAFAITVILILAAGIGVSTAIFSVVRSVILRPLPYNDPDRLMQVVSVSLKTGDQFNETAPLRDALDWKSMVSAFQDVAMYRYALLNLRSGDRADSLYGVSVTANLLPLLGVRPQLGAWFPPEYDRPGSAHVIIISDDLWRRHFNADPHIVGKTIQMDQEAYLVLGVMPRGFNFPLRLATTALLPTDQMQYWVPLGRDLTREPHGVPSSRAIARLRDGVSIEQAQEQLKNACRQIAKSYPATNEDLTATLLALHKQTIEPVSAPLIALFAASSLLLILTCINVATLLLARGEARGIELAVRMALGGGSWRIARVPIIQAVLLCTFGCLVGIPLAFTASEFLLHIAPIDVPRLANAHVNLTAIGFAAMLALLCGLLVGCLNALQVLKRSPRDVLSGGTRTSSGPPRAGLRSLLVVVQIALAVVLVGGAGLTVRTFVDLLSIDIGYRPDHVLYGVTVLPSSQYPRREQRDLFFQKVLDRLRPTSGIVSAAASTGFPLVGQYDGVKVEAGPLTQGAHSSGIIADSDAVSSDYLETVGVRLLRGRLLNQTDTTDAPKVAVIDQTLASTVWPGQNPLGKFINSDDPAKPVWRQVVGVVAPLRNKSLHVAPRPALFLPLPQTSGYVNFLVIKTDVPPANGADLLRNAVASVDPNQGVFFIQSFPELVQNTIAVRRFLFQMLVFFGGAALALSTLGVYGLISFIAVNRTREVGRRERSEFVLLLVHREGASHAWSFPRGFGFC
jgi:putative ABC transport system permease protein